MGAAAHCSVTDIATIQMISSIRMMMSDHCGLRSSRSRISVRGAGLLRDDAHGEVLEVVGIGMALHDDLVGHVVFG